MKILVHKRRSVGLASELREPKLQLHHLLFELPALPVHGRRELDFILVGQVTLVQYFKSSFHQFDKTLHVETVHQRLSDVIDLSAGVFTARVFQEEDVSQCHLRRSGGQVNDTAIRILPDSVELSFDDMGALPNGPARKLFSAVMGHMLWDDCETFQQWLVSQRFVRDQNGKLCRNNAVTERQNMG
ncbi:hypothetical protein CI807_08145 [Pseudomonas sp. NS1(2017)]|nr:hypothetical protein CI807_08145 [Pseudomonas sp. NS1(2017)]